MKTAIITGISGQDGHYLARLLLSKGYFVVGTSRKPNILFEGINDHDRSLTEIVEWNLVDQSALLDIIKKYKPAEIYNLAALSSGSMMFENPVQMMEINGLAVTKILDVIRRDSPQTKFCQASSSEVFGATPESPQNEDSICLPSNPYGATKLYADHLINIFRNKYGIYASTAILYNHESLIRPLDFVTRKITYTAAKIKLGLAKDLILGNLDTVRDWSFAGDAVHAMWLILQQKKSDRYIVSSGIPHSVRQFCEIAFSRLYLDYLQYVREDERFYRPAEPVARIGNPQKIKSIGWAAQYSFSDLVHLMVDHDLKDLASSL